MLLVSENSGIRCIKFSLLFFAVILVITGISLIIVGTTINEIFIEFSSFLNSLQYSPATLIISIGFLIFGIATFGCIGAFRESVCIITTFGILLGLTAFMQAGSGMLSNVLMLEIDKVTRSSLNTVMSEYSTDIDAKKSMDYLQRELHCCGLTGPKDWMYSTYNNGTVPESCCSLYSGDKCETSYNLGCHLILNRILMESSRILTVSAYLLALTQIFGMLFAFYLAKLLRQQKLARDYRRWTIRNQLLNNMSYESLSSPFYDKIEKKKDTLS